MGVWGSPPFQGPTWDGIGGSVKQKVYQDISSNWIVTTSAKHFAQYTNEVCNSVILCLDFYTNSPYKKVSNLIKGVNYVFTNDNTPNSDETDGAAVNETSVILIPCIGDLAVTK